MFRCHTIVVILGRRSGTRLLFVNLLKDVEIEILRNFGAIDVFIVLCCGFEMVSTCSVVLVCCCCRMRGYGKATSWTVQYCHVLG